MRRFALTVLLLPVVMSISGTACGDDPGEQPRETVMRLFQSMRADTASYDYLSQLLDLGELVKENSIYTYDTSLTLQENEKKMVRSLLEGGSVRERWLKNQIIVGSVAVLRDTATVEVSFVDKSSVPVKQYYNKMGVHLVDDHWKIFSFRLF